MSQPTPIEPIDHLVAEWLSAHRAGNRADCDALIAVHPELSEFLDDYMQLDRRFVLLRQLTGETPVNVAEIATLGAHDTAVTQPPKVGGSFGDYDLLAEVARGGMGLVYKARQRSLNRVVALKMVLGTGCSAQTDRDRFLVEARAVARLNHPHVVPIYEVGEHEGHPYFTMEFFAGGSLRERIEGLRGNQRALAQLMATIARAVEHAHRRGILHRDLKPGNVLLDERGQPHVTDFGLAKRLDEESDLTQAGAIVGTPSYMAPEQANAQNDLTTAVDVYGLGALLYHLLTGRPPFKESTPLETMMAAVSREPQRPRKLASGIDPDLESICLKCLEKEPLARYRSADALADDLERWLEGKPIQTRPASTLEKLVKWSRRQPFLAGALASVAIAVLGLLVLAGFLWQNAELRAQAVQDLDQAHLALAAAEDDRQKAESLADRQKKLGDEQQKLADETRVEVARLKRLADEERQKADKARQTYRRTTYAAQMQRAFIAVDRGNLGHALELLANQRPQNGEEDLRDFEWHYLWRLTHGEKRTLQDGIHTYRDDVHEPEGIAAVATAPDGRALAVAQYDGTIKVWDSERGDLLHTIQGPRDLYPFRIGSLAFASDGKDLTVIAVKAQNTDLKMLLETARAESQQPPSLERFINSFETLTWTLGGVPEPRVGSFDPALLDNDLVRADFLWGLEKNIFRVYVVARSPDGNLLAFGGSTSDMAVPTASPQRGQVVLWDVKAGRVKRRIEHSVANGVHSLGFSADGLLLALVGSGSILEVWEVAGEKKRWSVDGKDSPNRRLCFSADGRWLATGDWNGTVTLWDAGTGQKINTLIGHQAPISSLSFTRDGTRLVSGSEDGAVKLWDTATPPAPLLLAPPGYIRPSELAFADNQTLTSVWDGCLVRTWDARTGKVLLDRKPDFSILPATRFSPTAALAPNGQTLAVYLSTGELQLRPVSPGGPPSFLDKDQSNKDLKFSADSKTLAALGDFGTVKLWDVPSAKPRNVYKKPTAGQYIDHRAVLSPDGQTLAFPQASGVLLWNMAAGTERTIAAPDKIYKVAFSADGQRLATTSDRTLAIWDRESGQQLFNAPIVEGRGGEQLAFSPNGKRLAYAGYRMKAQGRNQFLEIWDTVSGVEVMTVPLWWSVWDLKFSPDGHRLAIASQPRNRMQMAVYVYDATPLDSLK